MKIVARECVIIKDCTPQLEKFFTKQLTFANPEYYKKLNQGRYVRDTPQNICLYERRGRDLYLPFGMLPTIFKSYELSHRTINTIHAPEKHEYGSSITPYPYQENAIKAALRAKQGIVVAPCGAGKTQIGLEIAARLGMRTLWLTHTHELLNQSMERAKGLFALGEKDYGTITGGKVDIGNVITFATVQTMAKLDLPNYRDCWDVVIVDECMPGNTLITTPYGKKELHSLRIGDIIASFNGNTGCIESKRVLHVFKNKAHDIVSVNLENGEKIVCTNNHPIFTRSQEWVDAERLRDGDYVLRLVRQRGTYRQNAKNDKIQSVKARILLLLKKMCSKWRAQTGCMDGGTQKKNICNYERYKQSVSRSNCRENEEKQSNAKARNKESRFRQIKRNWAPSQNQMWEWDGVDGSAAEANDCACRKTEQCVCGISDSDKTAKGRKISDLLQSGYCATRTHDCNRSGWQFTFGNGTQNTRCKKGFGLEWVRVESVTVQEQTSDGTFGGLCADGYVYNIEVEDNNNFFADDILVHNCHHCVGTPTKLMMFYKVVSNLSARYKYGLTATPERSDGLTPCMYALIGNLICEISKNEVKHTTCPVVVDIRQTDYTADMDAVTNPDGTLNYVQFINNIAADEARNQMIASDALKCAGSVLILTDRVSQAQRLKTLIGASCAVLAAAKKKERGEVLEQLANGDIKVLVATFQLAREGLDVPSLRNVIFATPQKNEQIITQAAGRVARIAEGKEFGTLIDYEDAFGILRGWQKKRIAIYKKLGYSFAE